METILEMDRAAVSCVPNVIYIRDNISHINAKSIKSQVMEFIRNKYHEYIWINMHQVSFMDSAGLGVMAEACSFASQQSCSIILYHVNPPVRLVFEISALDQILNLSSQSPGFPYSKLPYSYERSIP